MNSMGADKFSWLKREINLTHLSCDLNFQNTFSVSGIGFHLCVQVFKGVVIGLAYLAECLEISC
jgi:hypothetical protein